jgi:hypothetical protein
VSVKAGAGPVASAAKAAEAMTMAAIAQRLNILVLIRMISPN